jgi:hypothetical protein
MIRILGHSSAACDGLTRRELLRAGSLALLGGAALPASVHGSTAGRAKSVILLDLFGGPSHIDTFDLKPDAPAEIRGEFKPIATSLPGVQICEHLPQLASRMHRLCLVRSVSHRYNSHNPYGVMTGFDGGNDRENYFAKPSDHPGMGAVCQYFGVGRRGDLPGYVVLPAFPGYSQGLRRAGPYGGYLGGRFDPLFSTCSPTWTKPVVTDADFYNPALVPIGDPKLPSLTNDMTLDALDGRRSLVEQFDRQAPALATSAAAAGHGARRRQAFDLLLSRAARNAFDLEKEPLKLRERYGRDLFGSSTLLARRLVESGVTFVAVHTEAKGNGHWDTHANNFNMLRQWLLPFLDRAVSALLDDLESRGLLDTTLVVVTGDMGRTPRVNAQAGRDHWPQCGFCLFAGGGTRAGYIHGATDKTAAYPKEHPVSAGDLVATIYHLLGVDPEATVPDQTGRPTHISHGGGVVRGVLA